MTTRQDFPLSDILWYKIGGKTKYLLEAQNKEDVLQALDFIQKNNIKKFFIVGFGSNLIFSDDYFDGAVIRIACQRSDLSSTQGPTLKKTPDGYVETFAGETLDSLIQFSFNHNFIGLEWAGGLPGTVGAGVRGNVGAFGAEIKDTCYSAEVLTIQNDSFDIKTLTHNDLSFSYRNSLVKQNKNMIVISSMFILSETDSKQVERAKAVYNANSEYRKTHHPLEYPNCGSVFKNIVKKEEVEKVLLLWPDIRNKAETDWHGKVAMGYVIKRLGLSGLKAGSAQVSEKHANFIVNLGNAKAFDVLIIIEEIKGKFLETFGFSPEVEVEIVVY